MGCNQSKPEVSLKERRWKATLPPTHNLALHREALVARGANAPVFLPPVPDYRDQRDQEEKRNEDEEKEVDKQSHLSDELDGQKAEQHIHIEDDGDREKKSATKSRGRQNPLECPSSSSTSGRGGKQRAGVGGQEKAHAGKAATAQRSSSSAAANSSFETKVQMWCHDD